MLCNEKPEKEERMSSFMLTWQQQPTEPLDAKQIKRMRWAVERWIYASSRTAKAENTPTWSAPQSNSHDGRIRLCFF